ncbi:MAG: DNA polymerase III subunit gamma/tau [Potamolinea sp.]
MAYEPLHHKYRPQTFAHLVGQEAIATTLTNAILSERIAPAYLFTGPRGTGKTSSARILAKSLNCKKQDKPTASPCGVCEVCHAIAVGTALDVIEIDAASNTGVDNIRDIIERSQFAPVQCRYKVYVIDECHMLSTAAFNSLLKTLEEPPDRVVFVLATTDPQRVLPTIISRCQRFDFRRIPLEAMVRHLQDIAIKENIKITPEAVTLVSQVAQGGLRDAESLLDQLSLLPQEVTVEAVWDLVGAVPERDLIALTTAIASDHSETVLEQCRRLMDRGREPLVVLQNLAGFYRDLLIAKTAPSRSDLVAVTAPTWEQLCNFAQQLEVPSILQSQQHLKSSEAQIKNTTQPRLWLEITLLGLLPSALPSNAPSSYQGAPLKGSTDTGARNNTGSSSVIESKTAAKHPPETSQDSTNQLQQKQYSATPSFDASNAGVTPNQSQVPPEVVPVPSQHLEANPAELGPQNAVDPLSQSLEQVWQEVVANVQMRSIQALLRQHGQLIAYSDAVAIIGIRSTSLLKMVQGGLTNIEAAFQKVLNHKVKVNFQVGTGGKFSNTSPVNAPNIGKSGYRSETTSWGEGNDNE